MLKIPSHLEKIQYKASRIPNCVDQNDLSLGANCQVYAYAFLEYHGLFVPNYRSSELWEDETFSEVIADFEELAMVFYNQKATSYGAHIGIYVGENCILHLSKENQFPKIEPHAILVEKYGYFIGIKRVFRKTVGS